MKLLYALVVLVMISGCSTNKKNYYISSWENIPDLEIFEKSINAFGKTCNILSKKSLNKLIKTHWQRVCNISSIDYGARGEKIDNFFLDNFTPILINNFRKKIILTGYYEMELEAHKNFIPGRYPIYSLPNNFVKGKAKDFNK